MKTMIRTFSKYLAIISSAFLFFGSTAIVFAQGLGGNGNSGASGLGGAGNSGGSGINLVNPLGTTDFQKVLSNVSGFLLLVAAPLCGIMVLWGGFQMITAAGKPDQFSAGRKTLIYAAVGFVVVLFATSVVPLLKSILGG